MISLVHTETDITGKRFGYLKVIKQVDDKIAPSGRHYDQWECKCIICGKTTYAMLKELKHGRQCSCQNKNRQPRAIKPKMKFGELTVIKRADDHITPSGIRKPQWECECSCGKHIIVPQIKLNLHEKTHCGCKRPKPSKNKGTNTYDLSGDFGIGYTAKGEPFWFDLEDYDIIKEYCWHYDKRGYPTTNIRKQNGKYTTIGLHQLLMNPIPDGMVIDHMYHPEGIQSHKMDNRKQNLRLIPQSKNRMNSGKRKDNQTGYTGVYWDNTKQKWRSGINIHKKTYEKYFPPDQFEQACEYRKMLEEKYFGDHRYQGDSPEKQS